MKTSFASIVRVPAPFRLLMASILALLAPIVLNSAPSAAMRPSANSHVHHYLYAAEDGLLNIFSIDQGNKLIRTVPLSDSGTRGIAASPRTHALYISYGPDTGQGVSGHLLKYDLLKNRVVWTRTYSHGIDSMAITPDGKRIYMPDGELSSDGKWYVVSGSSGKELAVIDAGAGPHNTVMSLDGRRVYLGGRNFNYLEVASTSSNRVVKRIGPLMGGVRPFTFDASQTIAYVGVTGYLGFQVANIRTGRVLYTVPFKGFSWSSSTYPGTAPSHGISLSPNGHELYVMDAPNSYVHVFDVTHVPALPPTPVANIKLTRTMSGTEDNCAYDCVRDGWLLHSRSGRYVYVGDGGDVIDTRTRHSVVNLDTLFNTKKFLEIDFRGGKPVSTTTRTGLGY